ncbi:tRNA pseudouridine(55) synthase TruB [Flavobacteriaceae bacterium]|jgi:tRNA pseudouridine55 synthase|nr:tRNA pseudouridine(55) synthase TruB [Flavobacteriaceae bacterium]MDA8850900.1 tRNA pseudouridine(55) synthase TruB [Flavobacteriaceae bacterium]
MHSKLELNETLVTEGQLLLIDKPLNWTSFQVVNKIRWELKNKFGIKKLKVGHAGTLDPLATGLLLVCTGKMTKKISEIQALVKEYTGTFTLGATTPSYDLETPIDGTFPIDHLDDNALKEVINQFTGVVDQYPPVFSAIKKDGKRLYEYARKGEEIKIKSRQVEILAFELTKIKLPTIDFYVKCSKGTYIRSLANDYGKALGSGAHLSSLRRTAIGLHRIEDAYTIEQITAELEVI